MSKNVFNRGHCKPRPNFEDNAKRRKRAFHPKTTISAKQKGQVNFAPISLFNLFFPTLTWKTILPVMLEFQLWLFEQRHHWVHLTCLLQTLFVPNTVPVWLRFEVTIVVGYYQRLLLRFWHLPLSTSGLFYLFEPDSIWWWNFLVNLSVENPQKYPLRSDYVSQTSETRLRTNGASSDTFPLQKWRVASREALLN